MGNTENLLHRTKEFNEIDCLCGYDCVDDPDWRPDDEEPRYVWDEDTWSESDADYDGYGWESFHLP